MSATPLMIAIALHYHTRPTDYGRGNGDHNFDAPAVRAALRSLVDGRLLRKLNAFSRDDRQYEASEALTVYIDALCQAPWPVQRWVIPTERERL